MKSIPRTDSRSDGARTSHHFPFRVYRCGHISSLKPNILKRQPTDPSPVSILPRIG
jgi:hypothetical protein